MYMYTWTPPSYEPSVSGSFRTILNPNPHGKAAAKPFVSGSFRAMARLIGAMVGVVVSQLGLSPQRLGGPILGLGVLWLGQCFAMRKWYTAEFYASLQAARLNLEPSAQAPPH